MTRILVVEDEPGIALGLEDDLRLEGWDVELVADGIAALAACARRTRSTDPAGRDAAGERRIRRVPGAAQGRRARRRSS